MYQRRKKNSNFKYYFTPPNFKVCAWRKVPAKRFKNLPIFLPNECPGQCRHMHSPGHSLGKKESSTK